MAYDKKVRVHCPMDWNHHRFGWNYVVGNLREAFHTDLGIDLFTNGLFANMISAQTSYEKPWIGFLHITPSDPGMTYHLDNNPAWHKSLEYCRGLFTLSAYGAKYLRQHVRCPVESVYYCIPPGEVRFDPTNEPQKVYFIGHWLRDFDAFFRLRCPQEKILPRCVVNTAPPPDIKVVDYLAGEKYDQIFTNSIIFLSLTDASANTTILECIRSNTPIVVNRLPGIVEYLGADYPLLYEGIEQAEEFLRSPKQIAAGHEYLKNMNKSHLSIDSLMSDIADSEIYRSLPKVRFL